jgi:hypothetical protein
VTRWHLGRIDIFHEVSVISQYQCNPRVGHIEMLYHIFAFMKSHLDMGRLAYDPRIPDIDEGVFNDAKADWSDFYGDVEEEMLPKMPESVWNTKDNKSLFYVAAVPHHTVSERALDPRPRPLGRRCWVVTIESGRT